MNSAGDNNNNNHPPKLKIVTRLIAFLFVFVFYFTIVPNLEDFRKLGLGSTTI